MRIVIVNSNDIIGGAARAAYRLHKGLLDIGVDSRLLVAEKHSDDDSVSGPAGKTSKILTKIHPGLDNLLLRLYPNRERSVFSSSWVPTGALSRINRLEADLVHLNWITNGFVPINAFRKINKPVLWTLHDMWAFTGGCHYAGECNRFRDECGRCPVLQSSRSNDISRWIFRRKQKSWADASLRIVTPSRWLGECAKSSVLLGGQRVEVIPNGIDVGCYMPADRDYCRTQLNLPPDKQLILFGAQSPSDDRKGFKLLVSALQHLRTKEAQTSFELVIFGASMPEDEVKFDFPTHYLGALSDDVSLSLAFSAVDVFVAPSRQENLSNTVMESLACGTPVVAFDVGGMPDMIDHRITGYLACPKDTCDLAHGISWVLADKDRLQAMRGKAREKVENHFEIKNIAGRYLELYHDIVGRI